MPGFVKTKRDEAVWSRAKEAALKSHPASEDRMYATANKIFHSMRGGGNNKDGEANRQKHATNPGTRKPAPQFPLNKGMPTPQNVIDPHWQDTVFDNQLHEDLYYNKDGSTKHEDRCIPILGGGEGKVVGSSSQSVLAKKGGR